MYDVICKLGVEITLAWRLGQSGLSYASFDLPDANSLAYTELFKQFMDNESFRKWLGDTVFGLTYSP